jgi:2-methylcitrate dehydratase PrpD
VTAWTIPHDAGSALTRLVAGAATLRWEDIPGDVVDAAVDCMVDTVAVAVGGSGEETVHLIGPLTADRGPCTRLVDGAAVGMRSAALANGVAAHVLDFDDWLPAAGLHPSAPLLPAVLATAECVAASADLPGTRLLTAYVAGFEVQARIGAALAPGHYLAGFHPTATVGVFGAAAAAAHLLGLGPEGTARALGLAAAQAAGLRTSFGTMAKPLQVGRAAEAGVLATLLAAAGATAPEGALFGPGGFAATHSDTLDPAVAAVGFADHWYLREVLLKRHAACFGTHASIDALLELRDGLDPTRVHEIELTVPELLRTVCAIPAPQTALQAKFSLAHTAALALVRGQCQVADFTPDVARDPQLLAVAERVRLRFDPSLRAQQTHVRVLLDDGTTRAGTADSARLPPPAGRRAIARDKLAALAAPGLGAPGGDALMQALEALPLHGSVSAIGSAIRRHQPQTPGRNDS